MKYKKLGIFLIVILMMAILLSIFFSDFYKQKVITKNYFLVIPYKRYFKYKWPLAFNQPKTIAQIKLYFIPIKPTIKFYVRYQKKWIETKDYNVVNQDCTIKMSVK